MQQQIGPNHGDRAGGQGVSGRVGSQTERIGTRANAQPALPGCSYGWLAASMAGARSRPIQFSLQDSGQSVKTATTDRKPRSRVSAGLQIDVIQALLHAAINFRAKKSLSG